jgi:hypothetical protein
LVLHWCIIFPIHQNPHRLPSVCRHLFFCFQAQIPFLASTSGLTGSLRSIAACLLARMAFHAAAAADIPLLITSPNSSSERRITPSWSIAHFKTRLEPITGIPASSQKLTLRVGTQDGTAIEADDEEKTQMSAFLLQAYAEINVSRRELSCL